jgi:hypothetical protein
MLDAPPCGRRRCDETEVGVPFVSRGVRGEATRQTARKGTRELKGAARGESRRMRRKPMSAAKRVVHVEGKYGSRQPMPESKRDAWVKR